jgi:hypothetical protein
VIDPDDAAEAFEGRLLGLSGENKQLRVVAQVLGATIDRLRGENQRLGATIDRMERELHDQGLELAQAQHLLARLPRIVRQVLFDG